MRGAAVGIATGGLGEGEVRLRMPDGPPIGGLGVYQPRAGVAVLCRF